MNNLTVNDVKLKQYMLVTKAGLVAGQSNEKSKMCMENRIMLEFMEAVNNYTLPTSFAGFDRNALFRTKNFLVSAEKLDVDDLHTGGSLWRKYREIRLILLNDFGAILAKKLVDGQPPRGKNFSDVLLEVRHDLHEANEDIAERKSKSVKGYKRHNFSERWYPAEWEAFITYGAGSPRPVESLISKKHSGPVMTGSPVPREVRKKKSRKEEPKIEIEVNQAERPVLLPKRTPQEMAHRKERKISKKRDATTAFGLMVAARKERVNELRMLMDLESDPALIESRRKTLMDFLDSTPPTFMRIDTSDEEDCLDVEDEGEGSEHLNIEADSFDRWNRVREYDGATLNNGQDDSDDSGDTEDNYNGVQINATQSCEPLPYSTASAAIPYSTGASCSSSSLFSAPQSVQQTDTHAPSATLPESPCPLLPLCHSDTERSGVKRNQSQSAQDSLSRVPKNNTKAICAKTDLPVEEKVPNLECALDSMGKKSIKNRR